MNQDTQTESHVQPRGSHIDFRCRNLKLETNTSVGTKVHKPRNRETLNGG